MHNSGFITLFHARSRSKSMAHHNPGSSTPTPRTHVWRGMVFFAAFCVLGTVLGLSGCGSSPSGAGSATSTHPTTSATAPRPGADCSREAILAALPGGATMKEFECAKAGDIEWAAALVDPGSTAFFLRWHGDRWDAEDSDSVCGTAAAGLPSSLLSYCTSTPSPVPPSRSPRKPTMPPQPKPTSPATPTTPTCTSASLLAALPRGSRMEEFSCADVSGKRWAAVRVDPGDTVFFLQSDGRRWNAQDSDSVCGTASAGLPPSLLAYCK